MIKKLFILLVLSLPVLGCAQGITFQHGSLADVFAAAKKTNRPVFIDVFTTWCGPCKLMAKNTFTDPQVGEYANAHYITYQLDAEKGEGEAFARKYKVAGFPSILFFTAEGKYVGTVLGYEDSDQFKATLQKFNK